MDIIFTLICVVVVLVLYWFKRYYDYRQIIDKFPGRQYNYFFGDILNLSRKTDKLFLQIRESTKQFPDGYRIWAGFYACFSLNSAQDAEFLLSSSKHTDKSPIYIFLEPWLQTGLLTSKGAKWQHRRKLLTPAFHFNILKQFVRIFSEHGNAIVKELEDECSKPTTDVVTLMSQLTLNIICETAMGITLNSNNEDQNKYREAIHGFGPLLVRRTLSPWVYYPIIYNLTAAGRQEQRYIKILHEFTTKVIKERERTFTDDIQKHFEAEDSDEDCDVYKKKKRFAMLDLLLSAKKNNAEIDDEGIREEVDTFMFEGHDTTAMGLSFALLMLANHKDLQDRVRDEIDGIFQKTDRNANYQDLQDMHYLDMFIKETLRLYPSVPFIGRFMEEATTFRNGKYTVPAQTDVHLHIYDLHRDARMFPDPERFDPDRFLPENVKGRHPYAYTPFSAGPRNCIGQRFAMLEMKSVLSSVLRYYELDPIDTPADVKCVADLVLRPKNGIHMKFRRRL